MQATAAEERRVQVAGCEVRVQVYGSGAPLVVIHQDVGANGWSGFFEALGRSNTVYVPDLPGWGESPRQEWMRSVRDLAVVMQYLLDDLGLDRTALMGLGFGGWVAAEMATMDQARFSHLVLVGAAGVQPPEGEILDQFLLAYDAYTRAGFAEDGAYERVFGEEGDLDTLMAWDIHREMIARLAWKPYLFSQTLPHLLQGLRVPTLLIWGGKDGVIPVSAGRRYAESIPGSRSHVIDGAGHFVELERTGDVAALVESFIKS